MNHRPNDISKCMLWILFYSGYRLSTLSIVSHPQQWCWESWVYLVGHDLTAVENLLSKGY